MRGFPPAVDAARRSPYSAAIGIAFVGVPLAALLIRAPWSRLRTSCSSAGRLDRAPPVVVVSLAAAALSLAPRRCRSPGSWRAALPGRKLLRAVVILPLVLPPVVGGIGLLAALGRSGVVGRWLRRARDPAAVHDLGGRRGRDVRLDPARDPRGGGRAPFARPALRTTRRRRWARRAATSCGASRCRCSRPQLAAGLVLAWARALGEFGATITFAGNLAGRTQTLPLAVYQARQTDPGAAVLLSLLLVVLSLVVLVAMRDRMFAR